MPFEKLNANEAVSDEGLRIKIGQDTLVFANGTRYLTIPFEAGGNAEELRVQLSRMGSWMENGRPCENEGTLNVQWLRSRLTAGLAQLGRKAIFA